MLAIRCRARLPSPRLPVSPSPRRFRCSSQRPGRTAATTTAGTGAAVVALLLNLIPSLPTGQLSAAYLAVHTAEELQPLVAGDPGKTRALFHTVLELVGGQPDDRPAILNAGLAMLEAIAEAQPDVLADNDSISALAWLLYTLPLE